MGAWRVMCWVGLNPGTGDTDAGPRPTLRRVVSWASDTSAAPSSLSTCSRSGARIPPPCRRRRSTSSAIGRMTSSARPVATLASPSRPGGRTRSSRTEVLRYSVSSTIRCASASPSPESRVIPSTSPQPRASRRTYARDHRGRRVGHSGQDRQFPDGSTGCSTRAPAALWCAALVPYSGGK